MKHFFVIALAATFLPTLAWAQPATAPARPPAQVATKDPAQAPAGTYRLDPNHASVIARIGHMGGTSLSTFRFNKVSGELIWDPARIEAARATVNVDPRSAATPVENFAADVTGPRFLNTERFPDARFVTVAVRRTGPTTGVITGELTLMGVTKSVDIEAELVGVGRFIGNPIIGFTGRMRFNRSDFGMTSLPIVVSDPVELILDVEFAKTP